MEAKGQFTEQASLQNGAEAPEQDAAYSADTASDCKTGAGDVLLASGSPDVRALQLELARARRELEELRGQNALLSREIENQRDESIDREYESGFFIEDEVVRRIERENRRLKNLTEEVYSDVAAVWFKMVKDRLRCSDEEAGTNIDTLR